MAAWAIGDIHGHVAKLKQLLDKLAYNPKRDQLYFIGDLVNRGPESLATLRLVYQLSQQNPRVVVVLGNHDIYLLALHHARGARKVPSGLQPLLQAPDRDQLLAWLLQQRLAYYHQASATLLVHAGIHPYWNLVTCQDYAHELERQLQRDPTSLGELFGNQPDHPRGISSGIDELRFALNVLTRMRYLDAEAALDFERNGAPSPTAASAGVLPWYLYPNRQQPDQRVVFGHWAALGGDSGHAHCWNIDSGCAWGGPLTALDLATGERVQSSTTAE